VTKKEYSFAILITELSLEWFIYQIICRAVWNEKSCVFTSKGTLKYVMESTQGEYILEVMRSLRKVKVPEGRPSRAQVMVLQEHYIEGL